MLGSLSHDLRTPLNNMINFINESKKLIKDNPK